MKWLNRLTGKETDENQQNSIELPVYGQINDIVATAISDIAALAPDEYTVLKVILMDYGKLIRAIMLYKHSNDPQALFLILQEFVLRSISGFTDEIEKEKVNPILIETIGKLEQAFEKDRDEEEEPVTNRVKREDWGTDQDASTADKKALEDLDDEDDIARIKGIGKVKASKLRTIGINTVAEYKAYQEGYKEDDSGE